MSRRQVSREEVYVRGSVGLMLMWLPRRLALVSSLSRLSRLSCLPVCLSVSSFTVTPRQGPLLCNHVTIPTTLGLFSS